MSVGGLELASRDRVRSSATQPEPMIAPRLRRIVGILTGISAFYVTVAAPDVPCRDRARHGGSAAGTASMPHQDGSEHTLPAKKGEQPNPCKSAAIPCCVGMTSCSTITVAERPSSIVLPLPEQIVAWREHTKPLSRVAAPEPPPPKA